MYIKSVGLTGYGPFENVNVDLWSEENPDRKVTILIGENGAGKSCFLNSFVYFLDSFICLLIRDNKRTPAPTDDSISNARNNSVVDVKFYYNSRDYDVKWVNWRSGYDAEPQGSLNQLSELVEHYRRNIKEISTCSFPLLAYYPSERSSLPSPNDSPDNKNYNQTDGYTNSTSGKTGFYDFFQWFKYIEQIRNSIVVSFDELLPYIDKLKIVDVLTEIERKQSKIDGRASQIDIVHKAIDMERVKNNNPELYRRIAQRNDLRNTPEYTCVSHAISIFLNGFTNLRVSYSPKLRFLIDKDDHPLDLLQLSQGEKSLLALVGDIARRLALMNPGLDDPLQGEGIVLIDEIDLHLHPRWQRSVVRRLRETFPNCQFILTTHSPLVISDPDNVQVLILDNGTIREEPNIYGMDVEQIFLEVMKTPLRYEPLQEKIDSLLNAIQDRDFKTAKQLRMELSAVLPQDHRELARADIILRRQEAIHAKGE